jgi:hypothetical protein
MCDRECMYAMYIILITSMWIEIDSSWIDGKLKFSHASEWTEIDEMFDYILQIHSDICANYHNY